MYVSATRSCGDTATCSVQVSWFVAGDSDIASFTVTGNKSNAPTTVDAASGAVAPDHYSVGWDVRAGASLDTAFTVTATNADGTSAPATATVEDVSPNTLPVGLRVTARNNGARADVLRFTFFNDSEETRAVTVNGKKYAVLLRPTSDKMLKRAVLTMPDKNGKKRTTYRVGGAAANVTVR
jgi:hypothetical protein